MVKKYLGILLTLVILTSSVYYLYGDDVKISIEKTRTKYFIQDSGWKLAATEYVNIYDGNKKMRSSSRTLYSWYDHQYAYTTRTSIWKDEIKTIQTYTFSKDSNDIEQFPLKNEFQCINCEGKIVHYEIRDIKYAGVTKQINSPFSFGNSMKIEWEDGNYYSKVFQQIVSDKIIIKYRPDSNDVTYSVRLFDPPLISFVSPTPADNTQTSNTSIEINVSITEANLKEVKYNWNGTNYSVYDENLVLAMNFNNLSALGENDTHVFDISGNGNNGTVTGATPVSDGKYDGAFSFDGDGDYVGLSSNLNTMSKDKNHTVLFWVKKTGETSDGSYGLVTNAQSASDRVGIIMTSNLRVGIYDGSTYSVKKSSTNLNLNEWYFVAYTFNGSLSLYLNTINQIGTSTPFLSGNVAFAIGSENDGVARYFNGSIDEVRIYNRSLSSSEIEQHYYLNLKKYDLDKWSLYVNQTDLKTNTTGISYNYYSCATNSTDSENCTETRTITRTPISQNITSNFSSKIGDIRNDFYGIGTAGYWLGDGDGIINVDGNNDGNPADTISNVTSHQNAFLNSNLNLIRINLALNWHINEDLTVSEWYPIRRAEVKWAYENNKDILFIIEYMPPWLADTSKNCTLDNHTCPPSNYTKWEEVLNTSINYLTTNRTYLAAIKGFEVWNEPDSSMTFLSDLTSNEANAPIRSKYYNELWNNSYQYLSTEFPGIPVGGMAFSNNAGREIMFENWLSNFTTDIGFVSTHQYRDENEADFDTLIQTDYDWITSNCSTYGANCSWIIISEYNYRNDSAMNNTNHSDQYSMNLGLVVSQTLNNYPENVSLMPFEWSQRYYYEHFTEYPHKFIAFLEGALTSSGEDEYTPLYNTTKNFATHCPAGATVYTSTSTTNDLVAVTCQKGDMQNVIIINKGDEAINLTLNLENFTESTIYDLETKTAYTVTDNSTNIGSIDQYEIIYLGSDLQSPAITTNSPSNTTYTTNTTNFNITLDEEGDTCYYSLDGASNISMTKQGVVTQFKATNTSMTDGSHTVVFSCNDTWDNWNTTSLTFLIDTTNPEITINYPSNTNYYSVSQLNYTVVEANPDKCWYSTNSSVNSSTVSSGTNFTIEASSGSNTWTVYCNDTAGNENQTSVTFYVLTTSEILFHPQSDYTNSLWMITFSLYGASNTPYSDSCGTLGLPTSNVETILNGSYALSWSGQNSHLGLSEKKKFSIWNFPRFFYDNYRIFLRLNATNNVMSVNLNTTEIIERTGIEVGINDSTYRIYRINENGGVYNDTGICYEQPMV